ncbi:MAG: hypothetical protein ACX93U_20585 [Salipiger thiooxidans]|uniref:hypothetical protein n=1 Tax=Salipiger thiooxidans TaxID=282683 RepID=UPI001CFC2321|nr:hypothetical protein [Salipiger thiooxidans]
MPAYSQATDHKLWNLLPSILRERDADQGYPLRALLDIAEEQADALEADIEQLGRNAFVETCEPWAIPYVGALVGTTLLAGDNRVQDAATAEALFEDLEGPSFVTTTGLRSRTDTLKTVYYRRRKSTLPMLEELARDVTGWAAHAVEFFERLVWSQWVRNRLRMHALATPDLRSVEVMDRIETAFDTTCRTVDVRPPSQFEGWENIPNIGVYLWRLRSLELPRITARRLGGAGDFRYHLSVLGNDAPLFSKLRREGDETGLATELHVPQAIRPAKFFDDLSDYFARPLPRPGFTAFYGAPAGMGALPPAPDASLFVVVDGAEVPPDDIRCRTLETWAQPLANQVAIDVVRGRMTLGANRVPAERVEVWRFQGVPGELGGGTYRRTAWLISEDVPARRLRVNASGAADSFASLGDALAEWVAAGRPDTIIRIEDNRSYDETPTIQIAGAQGRFLAIEAADGVRPHIRLASRLRVQGANPDFTLTLGGLLIEGAVDIPGSLGRLRLIHTTLVPGGSIAEPDPDAPPAPAGPVIPSVRASAVLNGDPANTELRVEMAFSITGQIRVPESAEGIFALDCAIDGQGLQAIRGLGPSAAASGPALHLERCTLRGDVNARQIDLATETIFDGVVTVERRQTGCVRFSYVTPGSETPRRYRCQPGLAERAEIARIGAAGPLTDAERAAIRARVRARVRPEYTSEDYGDPAYLQLALLGAKEIATGAEDGSEMGVWCHLKQPQRAENLRTRLEEYLPFGLDPGIIYVT